jgi:hypothetical protein
MNPEQAWTLVKPRVDAMSPPERALRAWRFDTVRGQLATDLKTLRERADALAAVYASPYGDQLRALIESVDQLSLAGTLAQAQLERAVTAAGSPFQDVVERAQALRKLGLHWLSILERLGAVSTQEGDAIRAGRGHLDTAGDLQALASLLTQHEGLLGALQAHQQDATLRLSAQSADQMRDAARALLEAERQNNPALTGTDWSDAARRLTLLLEQDWDKLRGLVLGARVALDEVASPAEVSPSLAAFHRRA